MPALSIASADSRMYVPTCLYPAASLYTPSATTCFALTWSAVYALYGFPPRLTTCAAPVVPLPVVPFVSVIALLLLYVLSRETRSMLRYVKAKFNKSRLSAAPVLGANSRVGGRRGLVGWYELVAGLWTRCGLRASSWAAYSPWNANF